MISVLDLNVPILQSGQAVSGLLNNEDAGNSRDNGV